MIRVIVVDEDGGVMSIDTVNVKAVDDNVADALAEAWEHANARYEAEHEETA